MAVETDRKSNGTDAQDLRIRNALHAAFVLPFWTLFELMPLRWASALGGFLGAHLVYHFPYTRHLRTNIRAMFPHLSEREQSRLARQMMRNIGRTFAEYPHLGELTDPDKGWMTVRRWDVCERVESDERPVIYISGHLANWELTAGTGARRGVPVSVVYAPRRNAMLDRRLHRYRSVMKCRLIPRGDAARSIIECIKAKESVGMIVDQRVDDGILVPFFGRPALTTPSPARLAIKFNARIVPVECRRLDGPRFEMTFHDPICPEDFADAPDPVYAMTKRMNEHLERWITEHPGDWLCRKRRWSKSLVP